MTTAIQVKDLYTGRKIPPNLATATRMQYRWPSFDNLKLSQSSQGRRNNNCNERVSTQKINSFAKSSNTVVTTSHEVPVT
jgi:hypothetical protein